MYRHKHSNSTFTILMGLYLNVNHTDRLSYHLIIVGIWPTHKYIRLTSYLSKERWEQRWNKYKCWTLNSEVKPELGMLNTYTFCWAVCWEIHILDDLVYFWYALLRHKVSDTNQPIVFKHASKTVLWFTLFTDSVFQTFHFFTNFLLRHATRLISPVSLPFPHPAKFRCSTLKSFNFDCGFQ